MDISQKSYIYVAVVWTFHTSYIWGATVN